MKQTKLVKRLHPSEFVFPILSRDKDGVDRLEGTAFLLETADGPRAVTAAHVIRDGDSDRIWNLGVPTGRSAGGGQGLLDLVHITAATWNETIHVGCLEADLPARYRGILVLNYDVMFDWTILCWDYSPARTIVEPDGSQFLYCDAWAHRGNVVRHYFENGVHLMNTSFPTMQGASGSPLIFLLDGRCYAAGMVIGSLEQEFAPSILAQTVSVNDAGNLSETVKYFLPYGVALANTALIQGVQEFFKPRPGDTSYGRQQLKAASSNCQTPPPEESREIETMKAKSDRLFWRDISIPPNKSWRGP